MTNNTPQQRVTITINDDRVRVRPGLHDVADLKRLTDPPVPPDHLLWIDVDDGPDIQLANDGQIEVSDKLTFFSQGPDGAHPDRVRITIDGQRVAASAVSVTGTILRNLVNPPIPADRDLWRDIDGSPDEQIDDDEVVTLARGAEFYSVPRLITPGSPQLRDDDAAHLAQHEYRYSVQADGSGLNVVLHDVGLPPGLSVAAVDVLITLPGGFNDAGPDMFWCNPAITLPGGGPIAGTESTRDFDSRSWQRWSRHIGNAWRPGVDNLATYIAYVRRCLAQAAEAAA